jgi:DNA adenine methylase
VRLGTVKRPALRWHGGKWRLAPWIIKYLPEHRIYVEPFGGAASVLLRKSYAYCEVYNDLDEEVVNFFRVVRERGDDLKCALETTPFARREFEDAYQASAAPMERARRLVIRSFMGFGSNGHSRKTGFRANSNRSGTTPAHDWKNYATVFPFLIERFRGVVIECRPAEQVLSAHDGEHTLHYVDPPYVTSTRSDPSKDYAHEMTDEDHIRLSQTLQQMMGAVVLSGYPSPLYRDLYRGWKCVRMKALADGASKRIECLWLNAQAVEKLKRRNR